MKSGGVDGPAAESLRSASTASSCQQGPIYIACHVIQRILNARSLSYTSFYDVAPHYVCGSAWETRLASLCFRSAERAKSTAFWELNTSHSPSHAIIKNSSSAVNQGHTVCYFPFQLN